MPSVNSIVADDQRCLRCGYDLRGQSPQPDGSGRWIARCPECGSLTGVAVAGDAKGRLPWQVSLGILLIGAWFAWQLVGQVARAESQMAASLGITFARYSAAPSSFDIVDALAGLASSLIARAIGLFLGSAGIGGLVALAPYASGGARFRLAAGLAVLGCLIGFTEQPEVIGQAIQFGGRGAQTIANPSTWSALGVAIGIAIGFGGVRLGLAYGRPLARTVCAMFLPPDIRPRIPRD